MTWCWVFFGMREARLFNIIRVCSFKLDDWPTDRLTKWMTTWLIDWLTDWLTDWLAGWQAGWLTDWLIDWPNDWTIEWLNDRETDRLTDQPNERTVVNERTNQLPTNRRTDNLQARMVIGSPALWFQRHGISSNKLSSQSSLQKLLSNIIYDNCVILMWLVSARTRFWTRSKTSRVL